VQYFNDLWMIVPRSQYQRSASIDISSLNISSIFDQYLWHQELFVEEDLGSSLTSSTSSEPSIAATNNAVYWRSSPYSMSAPCWINAFTNIRILLSKAHEIGNLCRVIRIVLCSVYQQRSVVAAEGNVDIQSFTQTTVDAFRRILSNAS